MHQAPASKYKGGKHPDPPVTCPLPPLFNSLIKNDSRKIIARLTNLFFSVPKSLVEYVWYVQSLV